MIEHGPVVTIQIRFAFCAVDDECVDLAETGFDLECGGEHCAAHADDTRFTDTFQNGFRILKLFFRQRSKVGARSVQAVVLDHYCHQIVAQRVRSRFDLDDLAGNRRMNRSTERSGGIVTDLLAHFHLITYCHKRLAGSTDVCLHRYGYFFRRSYDFHRGW